MCMSIHSFDSASFSENLGLDHLSVYSRSSHADSNLDKQPYEAGYESEGDMPDVPAGPQPSPFVMTGSYVMPPTLAEAKAALACLDVFLRPLRGPHTSGRKEADIDAFFRRRLEAM